MDKTIKQKRPSMKIRILVTLIVCGIVSVFFIMSRQLESAHVSSESLQELKLRGSTVAVKSADGQNMTFDTERHDELRGLEQINNTHNSSRKEQFNLHAVSAKIPVVSAPPYIEGDNPTEQSASTVMPTLERIKVVQEPNETSLNLDIVPEAVLRPNPISASALPQEYRPLSPLQAIVQLSMENQMINESSHAYLSYIYESYWKSIALEKKQSVQASSKASEILNRFRLALKYGRVCNEDSSTKSSTRAGRIPGSSTGESMRKAALREVMSRSSRLFIEYSRQKGPPTARTCAAMKVSSSFPSALSLLFDSSPYRTYNIESGPGLPSCGLESLPSPVHPPSNVIISSPPDSSMPASTFMYQAFDCVQLIGSFESLFTADTTPLPFDLEDSLGTALCRCNVTILPSSLPSSSFFSNWEGVEMLVLEAVQAQGLCSVEINSTSSALSSTSTGTSSYVSGGRSSSSTEMLYIHRVESTYPIDTLSTSSLLQLDLDLNSRVHIMSSVIWADKYLRFNAMADHLKVTEAENLFSMDAHSLVEPQANTHLGHRKGPKAQQVKSDSVSSSTAQRPSSWSNDYSFVRRSNGIKTSPPVGMNGWSATFVKNEPARRVSNSTYPPSNIVATSNGNVTSNHSTDEYYLERYRNSSAYAGRSLLSWDGKTDTPSTSSRIAGIATSNSISRSITTKDTKQFREPAKHRSRSLPDVPVTNWRTKYAAHSSGDVFDDWIEREMESRGSISSSGSDNSMDSGRRSSRVEQLSWTSRLQQKALRAREDRKHYQRWMHVIRRHMYSSRPSRYKQNRSTRNLKANFKQSDKHPLIYLFGRHVTMLSIKIAQMLTTSSTSPGSLDRVGMVISLLTDSQSWEPHRDLIETLDVKNNFICHQQISEPMLAALAAAPELADVVIIQVDVFVRLLAQAVEMNSPGDTFQSLQHCHLSLSTFEKLFAVLLSLGDSVYVELPEIGFIHSLFLKYANECAGIVTERYQNISSVLKYTASRIPIPEAMQKDICSHFATGECLQVHISEIEEISTGGADAQIGNFTTDSGNDSENRLSEGSDSLVSEFSSVKMAHHGISVYTLLHLGIDNDLRKVLMKLYLDFPIYHVGSVGQENIFPWTLFVQVYIQQKDEPSRVLDLVHFSKASNDDVISKVKSSTWSVSTGEEDLFSARRAADLYWNTIRREMKSHRSELAAEARFSFVEHNSGMGFLSAQLALEYSNASVISLEKNKAKTDHHVRMVTDLNIENNIVCTKGIESDSYVFQRIYESPELFRFQLYARGLLEAFGDANDMESWGKDLGAILSSALTTFVAVPSAAQVSLVMSVFSDFKGGHLSGPYRPLSDIYGSHASDAESMQWEQSSSVSTHPRDEYRGFETMYLLSATRAYNGATQISLSPVYADEKSASPLLIRCDITNMTRHVHHHYDYAKDGHSRTYTMRVEVNSSETSAVVNTVGDPSVAIPSRNGEHVTLESLVAPGSAATVYDLPFGMHPNHHEVVSVRLYRDKDAFPIPYTSIYGVTLISILRMGLDERQRERLFTSFLKLPLYEDMAPWNIVLMGKEMAYIDYDTRDITFDSDVPKAYRVMSVLMNYKRTVEDFKRCGSKAPTVYGISFISDCVGSFRSSSPSITCSNLQFPVPCADGHCHSDYISCLRALSDQADVLVADSISSDKYSEMSIQDMEMSRAIAAAMKSGVGAFDNKGFVSSLRSKQQ